MTTDPLSALEAALAMPTGVTFNPSREYAIRAAVPAIRVALDYAALCKSQDATKIEELEHNIDVLRTRLVEEHEGHHAEVQRKYWEREYGRASDEIGTLTVKLQDAAALILKLQGHMNEGCAP